MHVACRLMKHRVVSAVSCRQLSDFMVRDPNWHARVEASFGRQTFMAHLGAELVYLKPGEVHILARRDDNLQQQHGFFHAGVTTAIADSAAGYAALTLFGSGSEVLTTELKINLLNPAQGDRLLARGVVCKPGKTLTICRADVHAVTDGRDAEVDTEVHVATALLTMMQLQPRVES